MVHETAGPSACQTVRPLARLWRAYEGFQLVLRRAYETMAIAFFKTRAPFLSYWLRGYSLE
jgi:hypothetical protein